MILPFSMSSWHGFNGDATHDSRFRVIVRDAQHSCFLLTHIGIESGPGWLSWLGGTKAPIVAISFTVQASRASINPVFTAGETDSAIGTQFLA